MPGTATIRRLRGGFEKCCNVDRKLTWRRETDDTLLVVGLGSKATRTQVFRRSPQPLLWEYFLRLNVDTL